MGAAFFCLIVFGFDAGFEACFATDFAADLTLTGFGSGVLPSLASSFLTALVAYFRSHCLLSAFLGV